jgi:hypothetical protein
VGSLQPHLVPVGQVGRERKATPVYMELGLLEHAVKQRLDNILTALLDGLRCSAISILRCLVEVNAS